jgi:hypothetical protein
MGVRSYQKDSKKDPEKWIESYAMVGRRFFCLFSSALKLSAEAGSGARVSGICRFHIQPLTLPVATTPNRLDRAVVQFVWIVQN